VISAFSFIINLHFTLKARAMQTLMVNFQKNFQFAHTIINFPKEIWKFYKENSHYTSTPTIRSIK